MHSILLKHRCCKGPILHNLRRKLHKIALNATQATILDIGKKAMQSVAELVEEGLGFINRQQCRSITYRTSEITYDRYYGQDTFAVLIALLHISTTPRTARLACAGMEIHIESSQRSVIAIKHLIHLTLGVVKRSLQRSESYAIQTIAEKEDTTLHIVQRQILTHLFLLNIVILITYFFGEIPPIPRFEDTLIFSVT